MGFEDKNLASGDENLGSSDANLDSGGEKLSGRDTWADGGECRLSCAKATSRGVLASTGRRGDAAAAVSLTSTSASSFPDSTVDFGSAESSPESQPPISSSSSSAFTSGLLPHPVSDGSERALMARGSCSPRPLFIDSASILAKYGAAGVPWGNT